MIVRDISSDMETLAKALDLMACQHVDISDTASAGDVIALGDGATWAAMAIRKLSRELAATSEEHRA